jgi:hypothetical protein
MFNKKNAVWVLFLVIILAFALLYYFLGNVFLMREDYTVDQGDAVYENKNVKVIDNEGVISVIPKKPDTDNNDKNVISAISNDPNTDKRQKRKDIKKPIRMKRPTANMSEPETKGSKKTYPSHDRKLDENKEDNDESLGDLLKLAHSLEASGDEAVDEEDGTTAKIYYKDANEKNRDALGKATNDSEVSSEIEDSLVRLTDKINELDANDGFQSRSPQSGGDLEFQYMMDRPRVL